MSRQHRGPEDEPLAATSPAQRSTHVHPIRTVLRVAAAGLTALLAGAVLAPAPAQADPGPARERPGHCPSHPGAPASTTAMRATWISSVVNIDWPSKPGLSVATQQKELRTLYDEATANKLNAVFVQIRPTADALWPSPHEPWSQYLTGTQGKNPGYDPLKFAVAEAHKRGLQFHGWFNPYRVSMTDDLSGLTADHPAKVHPDWVFKYGGRYYYNPGIPEVRAFVQDAMMDAVENYDLDGVHFDDYFYPYPAEGETIPDQQTFEEHKGSFTEIGAWRRNNVNLLVKEMGERIHAVKPDVDFGISPFGIWRNRSSDPKGSDTTGFESYSGIYADSRAWVKNGWIDYINPQVYWEIGLPVADYAKLVPWWSGVVTGTDVELYIGQAAYKVGTAGAWADNNELSDHLTFNRKYPQVDGDVYFSAKSLRTNAAAAMDIVVKNHYASAAGERGHGRHCPRPKAAPADGD